MIITAMLLWYDEPPDLLRQAVDGAAVVCDRIVAADGAYELVPDKNSTSPAYQRRVIKQQAWKHGLEVEFLRSRIYPGQVAKRNAVLQVAKRDSHWVMVVDADWRITGDRKVIREKLAEAHWNNYEQICTLFVTPDGDPRNMEEKAANHWHVEQAGRTFQMPFIYRSMPKMEYRNNHWSIFCTTEDGRDVGLFGASGYHHGWDRYEPAKTGYINQFICIEHMCLHRDTKQIERNREYIRQRDKNALEMGYET